MSRDLEGQGQGHPRSYIDIIRKMIGVASGIQRWGSDDLEGEGHGHPRSNIDIMRKILRLAWGVFPCTSRDFGFHIDVVRVKMALMYAKSSGLAWKVAETSTRSVRRRRHRLRTQTCEGV